MKLLLDTHVSLWSVLESPRLSSTIRSAIGNPGNAVHLSIASVWERAIKQAKGDLRAPLEEMDGLLSRAGIALLPITLPHALAAGALPRHHGDPFDRMLVAQAVAEGMTLVSEDRVIADYGVPLLG